MKARLAAALTATLAVAASPGPAGAEAPPLATAASPAPASPSAPGNAGPVPAPAAAPPSLPATQAVRTAPAPVPEPIKLPDDPVPSLTGQTFTLTAAALERYRALADQGGWPRVPDDATRLKPGDGGPAATALRKRLVAEGDLSATTNSPAPGTGLFDEEAAAALRHFQARHGLEETGTVGPRTLIALNVPASTRVRQLQASLGRLLGSRFAFGDRYVVVNIPSATVEAIDHGTVAHRYVAVVGKPDRPSPTLETRITSVRLNPTWTVPTSLIRKDIIPHVRKDPGYLERMKIRLFDAAGQEVDPKTIDWSTERAAGLTVRQDPGFDNSLGEVRLDMPNPYAVYMHDTPAKRLFARSSRAQSSGCVRVSGVKGLAGWLLEGTPGPNGAGSGGTSSAWGPIEIETAVATGVRQDVKLARSVPVTWVYLTGFGKGDGTVQFRDDVYGLDDPSGAAQNAPPQPPLRQAERSGPGPATQQVR